MTVWADVWLPAAWADVWADALDSAIASDLLAAISMYASMGATFTTRPEVTGGPTISPAITGDITANPVTDGALP